MNTPKFVAIGLLAINLLAGCRSDIVCTERMKLLDRKCVYIEPLKTEEASVGRVLRDVLEKEFVRKQLEICDCNNATMFISGAAFLTERSASNQNLLVASGTSSQAIESVSLIVKDRDGQILATASYDNNERFTASKLAKEFGGELANKLK